ncbi:MAG: YdcF family protein [Propionibacteriales bacterium]|nr:YdcF family protein [Propionibacteriales bacterium]
MSIVLAVISFWWYRRSVAADRRRLRNGVLLLAVVWFGLGAIAELATWFSPIGLLPLIFLAALLPFTVLALIVFLIANGFTMIRKEGRSVGNLLSLLAGIGLIAAPVLAVALFVTWQPVLVAMAVFLLLCLAYAGIFFTVLLIWSYAYSQMSVRLPADGIVILGSGLIRGKVPPLLAGRLDRAIEIWRYAVAEGRQPVLVPSGGQGADEPVAEGTAMTEYLISRGIPAEAIITEDRARNTEENLRLSRDLLDRSGHTATMLVVTSSYHVMRAALLARDLGLKAQSVGARTAAYYLPSAFLREFVAVLTRHRRMHVLFGIAFALIATLAGLTTVGLR